MVQRIHIFLGLFAFVSYLETIGSTYTISAVQSIERQFQIPSKLSGFLLSAHDISYIPSVIFVSYYGSKGNRAKWIGSGALIIAGAQLLISTPNFVFRAHKPQFNLTEIEDQLRPDPKLLEQDASLRDYFSYPLIRDRIPSNVRQRVLEKLNAENTIDEALKNESPIGIEYSTHNESIYQLDEPLISEALMHIDLILKGVEEEDKQLVEILRKFVENRTKQKVLENQKSTMGGDLKKLRKSAIAPFAYCNMLVNEMRHALKELSCSNKVSNVGPLLTIFCAMLFLGIGRTMPWALGIPLIDDNVKKQSTPVYFAVISFIKILGPICGFLIGSVVNKLYFTFPTKAPPGLNPQDPQWIGAWWLGYLFIGLAMIIPSCFLFFFPESSRKNKKLAKEHGIKILTENKKQKMKLTLYDKHAIDAHDNTKTNKEQFTQFFGAYKNVLSSKVYVASVVGRVMDVLAFKGYLVFLPKFLENHYGIPQYKVHTLMAAFGVFGFACGAMSGGFIMRKLKLNGRQAALFLLFVSAINTGSFVAKSFFGCHSTVNSIGLAGVPTNFNYTNECNQECGCQNVRLFPVCDKTGRPYYSPCQAGCRHVTVVDIASYKLKFSECSCAEGGVVKKEYCEDDCKDMAVFFFIAVIIGSFAAGCGMVPAMLILLRSVPPATRSISLGLQGFLVSLIGTLPSPIFWGFIVDAACLLWDQQACNTSRGAACLIYDPTKLRVRMHMTYAFIRLISTFNDLFVFYHAKDLVLMDEDKIHAEDELVKENIQMNTIPE